MHSIGQVIAERDNVAAADLNDHPNDKLLASDTPIVLRGLAKDWPAVEMGRG